MKKLVKATVAAGAAYILIQTGISIYNVVKFRDVIKRAEELGIQNNLLSRNENDEFIIVDEEKNVINVEDKVFWELIEKQSRVIKKWLDFEEKDMLIGRAAVKLNTIW